MYWRFIFLCMMFLPSSFKTFAQPSKSTSFTKSDTVLFKNLLKQSEEKSKNDPASAIRLANQAKEIAEQIKYAAGSAAAMKRLGIIYYLQGQFLQSLANYQQALAIFDSLQDKKGAANILTNIGAIYYDQGENTIALKYQLRALQVSEQSGDTMRIATAMNNIGGVYMNISDTSAKAVDYFRRSLMLSRQLKDGYMIGTASVNLGEVLMNKGMYDSALVYFEESLKAYEGMEDASYTLTNIGKLYTKNRNFSLALKYQQQAYDHAKKTSNKLDMVRSLNSLAQTYYQTGKTENALGHYRQAESLATEIGSKMEMKAAYEGLAKIYADMGDYKSAFKYQSLFTAIKDTLYNIESNNKLAGLQFDFDIEKKQHQINSLTQQKELSDLQLKKERIFRLGLFIGLALIFIIAFTQWRNSRHRQKANRLLQVQKIKTEQQMQKAEKALVELKAVQAQLIQSEKMASLGELTAGIAHEILNPLNFVSNFSEVNKELLTEMTDEIDKGNLPGIKALAKILIDNQEKINEHGKRADAIVKGMLQHSRTSAGQKEPTNINALADEYLRLSYHGMRAKDKEFNVTMTTDFDNTLSSDAGKINIIPQDIGRVLLNLYNNAFYAVNEKTKVAKLQNSSNQYKPLVVVSTRAAKLPEGNHNVVLTVKDNGIGIPPAVTGKIFQPFFTTKPTGQGTGLGLSLSYDIIKAHGGDIKVESNEGDGTTFIITVPG